MQGKRAQYRVRPALGVHGCGQVDMQALDRHRHRPGATLRPMVAQPRTFAQVLRDLFQFTLRLGLHRHDCEAVVEYPLQLALMSPQGPDGRRVLQPHALLLPDFGRTGRLAQPLPGVQRQGHAGQGFPRRMQQ